MPIDTSDDIRDLRRYPLLYCELYKYVYGGVIKLELNMNYFIAFIPIEESRSQKYNEIPILSTNYKRLLSPLPHTSYKINGPIHLIWLYPAQVSRRYIF